MFAIPVVLIFGAATAAPPMSQAVGRPLPPRLRTTSRPSAAEIPHRLSPPRRAALSRPAPASTPYYEDSGPAVSEIIARDAQDPAKCVEELLRLWVDRRGHEAFALTMACERVEPEGAAALFERIMSLMGSGDVDADVAAQNFFYGGASTLAEKLPEPEALLSSALAHGCWEGIRRYKCSTALKEKYLLQGLAKAQTVRCCIGDSLADCFTDAGIAPLRRIVHDLRDTPSWAGFRIAVRALAELDDTSIAPDLEYALQNKSLGPDGGRWLYQLLLVRGRIQNDRQQILDTLRTERENAYLLGWAIGRALLLKVPVARIESALRENGSMAAATRAEGLRLARQPIPPGSDQPDLGSGFDPLILTGDEVRQYRVAQQRHGPGSGVEFAKRYNLRALVASAPAD